MKKRQLGSSPFNAMDFSNRFSAKSPKSSTIILFKTLYNRYIRTKFPRDNFNRNGVITNDARYLDITNTRLDYKEGFISFIREEVKHDDFVLEVGAGVGVSTIVAARIASKVITYEAADWAVDRLKEHLQINRVDNVEIRHHRVGESGILSASDASESVTPIDSLPDCNVLLLDCEGAEIDISKQYRGRPRAIIVE